MGKAIQRKPIQPSLRKPISSDPMSMMFDQIPQRRRPRRHRHPFRAGAFLLQQPPNSLEEENWADSVHCEGVLDVFDVEVHQWGWVGADSCVGDHEVEMGDSFLA